MNLNVRENAELNLEMEELTEHTPGAAEVFNERFEQVLNNEASLNKCKADKSKYGDETVSVGRKAETYVGEGSFAFGLNVEASGWHSHAEGAESVASAEYSHAEGEMTKASGGASHAEGLQTVASEKNAHAEGDNTVASGWGSHAEGYNTVASGSRAHAEGAGSVASSWQSHAEGCNTVASGMDSHAEGNGTTALTNQHAQGHYNKTTTATANSAEGTSSGTAFVIGNGTKTSASNAFRVTGEGKVYASNTSISTGADYAEYFEWSDENPNNEDRVGYFVTFAEDNDGKIRIANKNDYVLGIISGQPCVLGNGDEDWKKRYILDDFGRYIKEAFEYEAKEVDEETGEEITVIKTGTKWKENPDYDKTQTYIPRDQRKEWSAVGMLGVLSVYDDGTCKVNGYSKCADGGIATASENGYKVIKRVTDNVIKVVFR